MIARGSTDRRKKRSWQQTAFQHGISAVVVAAATSTGAYFWSTATQIATLPAKVEALSGLPGQVKMLRQDFIDVRTEAALAVSRNIEKDHAFQRRDDELQKLIEKQQDSYSQLLRDHAAMLERLGRRR
jgi:hypothetical protein